MSSPNGARIQRALQGALVNAVLGNERIAREFDPASRRERWTLTDTHQWQW